MAFEITARTILQLGAELITSDAVAIYELVKNAVDAQSKDGVDIEFEIVLSPADYKDFQIEANSNSELSALKSFIDSKLRTNAPPSSVQKFRDALTAAGTVAQLLTSAEVCFRRLNRIIVSDRGHGMSLLDLKKIYLTIGTTNRSDAVQAALNAVDASLRSPYLGEKGVGRLSAMRLGRHLCVETATESDTHTNVLEIDWNDFEKAHDKPANSIVIEPRVGDLKAAEYVSGTKITISDLRASWTPSRLKEIAIAQLARMMDPFSWGERRRFAVRLKFNGEPIEHARSVAQSLLRNAHGICRGRYEYEEGKVKLTVTFESSLYDGAPQQLTFDRIDIVSMSGLVGFGEGSGALDSVGPFDFEIYWFNRQRLRAYEGVGDREAVRSLVKVWAGICLFRDGYRVLPYGDEGDDWLGLDIEALGASGYKLNTKQLIGRVRIGRISNPRLLDQTNRQGIQDCPEKFLLVSLLRDVISDRWRKYLNEAGQSQKSKLGAEFDPVQATVNVESLEDRARTSIRSIRKDYSGPPEVLQQVTDAFKELKDAHVRAVAHIGEIEEQKERLIQLAGIGLMIEVVAHELTRSIEHTEKTLRNVDRKKVDRETSAAFRALEQQIKSIQKRLLILEPLTVTARQRRVHRNVAEIVTYVIDAHAAQFERHGIKVQTPNLTAIVVDAFVIEGHVVQVLENLIANSMYWLGLYQKEFKGFIPTIGIQVSDDPPRIRFEDNGPGIPANRTEVVFEPFFSTRPSSTSRRYGLGLYIARQNAELLGGALHLIDEGSVHQGRFNAFELILRKDAE